MRGLLIKGVGGFYTVLAQNREFTLKARGKFRREEISPLVGDMVEFDPQEGAIERIYERKTLLSRPAVANVEQLVVVMTVKRPRPDLLLVDKLLVSAAKMAIAPCLVINKTDENEPPPTLLEEYGAFFPMIVSARTRQGLPRLEEALRGKISCFAGQSAVGKSSLLNALLPGLSLKTGELSAKTDRGRHTTRTVELWPYLGGALVDTPGFSMLDPEGEPQALAGYYPEMRPHLGKCFFQGCLHDSEPDCAVKRQIGQGLPKRRYERYLELLKDLKEKRDTRYD